MNFDFVDGEACYWRVVADQAALSINDTWNFQIDANITVLRGVRAFLTNGTSLYTSGNDTEVSFDG